MLPYNLQYLNTKLQASIQMQVLGVNGFRDYLSTLPMVLCILYIIRSNLSLQLQLPALWKVEKYTTFYQG